MQKVKNCYKLLMVMNLTDFGSKAIRLACSKVILLWPSSSTTFSAFSYLNHLIGMYSFVCDSSLITSKIHFLKRCTSEHSICKPDLVLSTTNTSSYSCVLYDFFQGTVQFNGQFERIFSPKRFVRMRTHP